MTTIDREPTRAEPGVHARRGGPGPPPASPDELVRTEVLDALAARWTATLTTVIAGPGFGKTTALAQAVRRDLAAPPGLDVFVTCEPGDEDAEGLARALLAAVGGPAPTTGTPVVRVLEALRRRSPVPVCVILDDVHELPAGSFGARLVAELLQHRPAHLRLVLAGRRLPPVATARLEAAGRLHRIDASMLAFRAAEVRVLADRADRPVAAVEDLAGCGPMRWSGRHRRPRSGACGNGP